MDSIRKVLGQMKSLVESAGISGANKTLLQKDMAAYQAQLKSLVASAGVDGTNFLTGTVPSAVIIGKDKDGSALTMTLDAATIKLYSNTGASSAADGLFNTVGANTWIKGNSGTDVGTLFEFDLTSTQDTLSQMTSDLTAIITKVDTVSASVAGYAKRREAQADFMTKITDIQESALSSMVDADLDEESARLSALQVQQQLATTALQIANSARSYILRLFQ